MPQFTDMLKNLGYGAAAQTINTGLGIIFGKRQEERADKRQLEMQEKLQNLKIQGDKQLTDYNYLKQLQLWKDTNYPAQMEQIKKANLNPALFYGMGGGGGATTNVATGSVQQGQAPSGGGEVIATQGMGIQFQKQLAELEILKAQAKNISTDTELKETNIPNIQADTENKILTKIITDFTGKEIKDIYEKLKKPNRLQEAKTYEDELKARQGVAGNIYELWTEGKLNEKSLAEIEQLLLSNAKSRAETINIYKTIDLMEENIKGAKLDNIIKELEKNLQTQTGLDRNSPAWMKILGRLFVLITNKN